MISEMELPSSIFHLKVFVNGSFAPVHFSFPAENWFDENGEFCALEFFDDFKSVSEELISIKKNK
jgi:hypothetical protein